MNSIGFPNTDIYSDHEQAGDESFWPAFTDIMMVIVMTFLLITVAVILNNWQLINNLKASVEAERQAMSQAQTALQVVQNKAKENETLEERLARLEDLLSTRTLGLQQARQQQQQTQLALNTSQQEVEAAQAAIQNLEQKNTQNVERLASTQQSLDEQSQQVTTLQKEKDDSVLSAQQAQVTVVNIQQTLEELKQAALKLQDRLQEEKAATVATAQQAKANLVSVQDKLDKTGSELEELRQKDIDGHERLASLQGEFDQLDKKYQKLLRPARSVKNKHVVRVVFQKVNGQFSYQLGDQDQSGLQTLSRGSLNKKLTALKQEHGDNLYVKIIIPRSSNVSHSDAWTFTSEMLNKYDYYSSEKE